MGPDDVQLAAVDEDVLLQLIDAAVADAHPNEVTPPADLDSALDHEWTAERVEWLRAFHRDRQIGLAGPAAEATWAVVVNGRVAGSLRLRATDRPGRLEIGLWLTRRARGRGIGQKALALVVEHATAEGVRELYAETTAANEAALAVLRRMHFQVHETGEEKAPLAGRSPGKVVLATRAVAVPDGR